MGEYQEGYSWAFHSPWVLRVSERWIGGSCSLFPGMSIVEQVWVCLAWVLILSGSVLQERSEQAMYFDAHVLDIQRKLHDIRGCRCRFLIRYDHDDTQVTTILPRLSINIVIRSLFHCLRSFPQIAWSYVSPHQETVGLKRLCRRPKHAKKGSSWRNSATGQNVDPLLAFCLFFWMVSNFCFTGSISMPSSHFEPLGLLLDQSSNFSRLYLLYSDSSTLCTLNPQKENVQYAEELNQVKRG